MCTVLVAFLEFGAQIQTWLGNIRTLDSISVHFSPLCSVLPAFTLMLHARCCESVRPESNTQLVKLQSGLVNPNQNEPPF
jgi:hypothetical protein